jgi:hypothetical protein
MALWRVRHNLKYPGLAAMRPRLQGRAHTHHLWALDAELRRLRDTPGVVLSGSRAATALNLDLAAPDDTLNAYIPAAHLQVPSQGAILGLVLLSRPCCRFAGPVTEL